jgi:hypothetical protein
MFLGYKASQGDRRCACFCGTKNEVNKSFFRTAVDRCFSHSQQVNDDEEALIRKFEEEQAAKASSQQHARFLLF